nr:O-antigen ligase family protein [uncultured Agathobaculum sp.]
MKQKPAQSKNGQAKGGVQAKPAAPSSARWGLYTMAAIALWIITCFDNNGSYFTQKVVGVLCTVGTLFMMLFAGKDKVKRLLTPPAFALFAYMLLSGISTLYARSRKFAIAEFAVFLAAFAVYLCIVLFSNDGRTAFRRAAATIAAAAAPVGLLSIDAASCNLLMRPVRVIMEAIGAGYGNTGGYFYSRLNTIFGNPNTYAGLMSIACLLSIWLVITAASRSQKILCTILLMVNAVSYLLAFSMGSLGVFVVACLAMLVLSPAEKRMDLFLLLVQTAVVALIVGAVSVKGFGDDVTGSFLPMIMLIVGCAAACVLEIFVREKLVARLADKGKLLIGLVAAVAVIAVVYLVAALNVTGSYTFGTEGEFRRAISLPTGDYSLSMQADGSTSVRVTYKNTNNLVQNNETDLASGSADAPVTFTVPEDSKLVFFYFGGEQGATLNEAAYTGAKDGSVKLGYKLLPAFIADRIQDLTANGNVVQRGVYRQDAIKLWKTSPVIGRGLGGFENGVVSVQDYYYETKYAHNHYVESLCDLGILGLAAFLAMLGTSIWALVKSRKEKPLIVMLLGACVLQMFGQAISDVTWSVGCCVPTFFAVLALVTLHCGDSLRLNVPNKSKGGAVRWPITAVSAAFIVLIGLNLIAQSKFSSDELTLDDLKQCASIDLFETNDYKLSYLISGGNEEGVADRYAADLSRVDSNAIAIPLAQYYAGVGDYTKALDALDRGAKYTRANAEVWQKMFSLYEQMIDPVGGSIGAAQWLQDDTYLNRMVKGYETLCQVNADQLDDVLLTAENNAFLGKLLAADALDPYDFVDALTIFSSLGLDTAYLPDADGNGVPDCAEVKEGSVTWNGGAFTADSDSTVVFSTVLKNEGSYELAVESSDLGGVAEADVDGAAVTLDASGKAVIEADRLGDSDEPVTIALHVRAGTTVSHVTWNKQ